MVPELDDQIIGSEVRVHDQLTEELVLGDRPVHLAETDQRVGVNDLQQSLQRRHSSLEHPSPIVPVFILGKRLDARQYLNGRAQDRRHCQIQPAGDILRTQTPTPDKLSRYTPKRKCPLTIG